MQFVNKETQMGFISQNNDLLKYASKDVQKDCISADNRLLRHADHTTQKEIVATNVRLLSAASYEVQKSCVKENPRKYIRFVTTSSLPKMTYLGLKSLVTNTNRTRREVAHIDRGSQAPTPSNTLHAAHDKNEQNTLSGQKGQSQKSPSMDQPQEDEQCKLRK